MRITDCTITRSLAHANAWLFMIEIEDNKFTGYFDDFGGFITMITECAKFFAIRSGKLRVKDAGMTLPVAPGTNAGKVLPGDKVR
jgi:hypothetical protein